MKDRYSTSALVGRALSYPWLDHASGAIVPTYTRWFYRLKAALCLLLYREPGVYDDPQYDAITVAVVDSGVQPGSVHGPTIYWATELKVGIGFAGRWWVTLHNERSC